MGSLGRSATSNHDPPRSTVRRDSKRARKERFMIILGVVLLIVGFLTGIPIIWTLGIIALVIGLILAIVGASGRAVGGRAHYW
jgi:uncharacterized membrane protein HdeD (DUF308 family)